MRSVSPNTERTALSLLVAVLSLGCGPEPTGRNDDGGGSGGSGATGQGGMVVNLGGNTGQSGGIGFGGTSTGGSSSGGACASDAAKAELSSEPVDILVVLDNSGSMHEEMGAVEQNINQNFANILTSSGVDYRVILLSRHREGTRTTGETAANTSVCVTTPLSSLATCPGPLPGFTDRFFQWSEKIESFDALNWLIDGYTAPPENDDFADLAPMGYGPFLRAGAKKVILVLTDDNEGNTGDGNPLTLQGFLSAITALSPAHFGTAAAPTFVFHSIIGLKEKTVPTEAYLATEPVQTEKCTGNGTTIPHVGTLYQELSRMTNGLRFPICQFTGYDAVFRRIAQDVTVVSSIKCDFDIPPAPAGRTVELDKVAVNHVPAAGGTPMRLGQAANPAECQPNAFYIESNRVYLCPDACNAVKADVGAGVEVLFTCESQILPPR